MTPEDLKGYSAIEESPISTISFKSKLDFFKLHTACMEMIQCFFERI